MRDSRIPRLAILVLTTLPGCAGGRSLRPPDSLTPLKKAAEDETRAVGRFSRKAVSDTEMLKEQATQQYRDSVVP